MMQPIFCWHHGSLGRLNSLLSRNPPLIDCPHQHFLQQHGLAPGHYIRISVKVKNQALGNVVALVELVSATPQPLTNPLHPLYPYAVEVKVLQRGNLGVCRIYPLTRV